MFATTSRGRRGFTIVELLIVIIIIVILAGLLLPAVLSALKLAKRTATQTEIANLGVALDQYQTDFGVYPPSFVRWQYNGSGSGDWPTGYRDGDWTWSVDPDYGDTTMDGAECLVFFLGGGPDGRGFRGPSGKTYGPYYEPKPEALITTDDDAFPELQDAFRNGQVYLYFKADRGSMGTEYTAGHNANIRDGGGKNPDGSIIPPKPGEPVRDSSGNYHLPSSFQIISAGPDGRYARQPTAGEPSPSTDDVTNFKSN